MPIMDIAIIGLGYVGSVSVGCLADLGHRIVGVDVDLEKVAALACGKAPIQEPGLEELISRGHAQGRITATHDLARAIAHTEVAMLAVGTPSREDGGIDDSALRTSVRAIGQAVRAAGKRSFVLISRSTSPPPVHRGLMALLEETSGLRYDEGLGYVCHPEFLREGVAIADFHTPPKIVFGVHGAAAPVKCKQLYPAHETPTFFVSVETAAMVKYADNCFHAVKVTFANEIGMACRLLGADPEAVMNLFCADRKLNISPRYLRPGGPFGGSCLPKDLREILHVGEGAGTPLKLLAGTYASNLYQIDRILGLVLERRPEVVGIVGLSFKEGTPDLRESPMLPILEGLRAAGVEVLAYDERLSPMAQELPEELRAILRPDLESVAREADLLVIHHRLSHQQRKDVESSGTSILEVARIGAGAPRPGGHSPTPRRTSPAVVSSTRT